MLKEFEKSLIKILCLVRLLIWLLAYFSDELIDDHDYSTQILLMKKNEKEMTLISKLLKCFVRWDSLFYVGIAENDYEYLKNHAFFPLYSKIVKFLADHTLGSLKLFKEIDTLILTGIGLNFIASVFCVVIFYRLSRVYLKDEELAKKAALLYIISPASIFFSAFYTETFFCLFTFLGYYLLYNGNEFSYKNILLSTIAFSLSGFIRSNGFFYLIIVGYQLFHKWIKLLTNKNFKIQEKLLKTVIIFSCVAIILVILFLPYVIVMKKPYETYCLDFQETELMAKPSFCQATIPNAYSYIQDKFWDVGFLTSWMPRKAFFVIWGIPMLLLMLIILVKYLSRNFINTILLGIPGNLNNISTQQIEKDAFYTSKNIPTILFTLIMFSVNAFFAHVNVSSRINSANPIIYWFGAYHLSKVRVEKKEQEKIEFSWKNHWILFYFLFYVIIGCTVFTNFYLFV